MNRRVAKESGYYNKRLVVLFIIAGMACSVMVVAFLSSFTANASESEETYKYYTSVEIQSGESLWTIASEHMTPEYHNEQAYINEVMNLNHLTSDTIHAGQHLTIPY